MEELGLDIILIASYVIGVGGGYLYEWIKKHKEKRKKIQSIVDKANHEIETELKEEETSKSNNKDK